MTSWGTARTPLGADATESDQIVESELVCEVKILCHGPAQLNLCVGFSLSVLHTPELKQAACQWLATSGLTTEMAKQQLFL